MKLTPNVSRHDGMFLIPTVFFIRTWTNRWLIAIAWLDFRFELHFQSR
jgi:hypothetical protein